jgi:hypothetical protein
MQTLAAVMADGDQPLDEVLVQNATRLRRGMTAVIITPSLDARWVRPLSGLRRRNVQTAIILLDASAFAAYGRGPAETAPGEALVDERERREEDSRAQRAVRHALAEHDLRFVGVEPGEPLGTQLVTRGPRPVMVASR